MLFLALSCLQGRPAADACNELLMLAPDGLQLTPGNPPSEGLRGALGATRLRTHHGFCWNAMRKPVWSNEGECLAANDSVHPPRLDHEASVWFWRRAEAGLAEGPALETMYPGYCLGTGRELLRAIGLGLWLAVDVSHAFIQMEAGALDRNEWRQIQRYDRIAEIHVSANAGRADTHRPLTADTFGLGWARERCQDGAITILESYMHKLTFEERLNQLKVVRGEV